MDEILSTISLRRFNFNHNTTLLRDEGRLVLELWGSAEPSNIKRIEVFQYKVLRTIVDAPLYVSNQIHHEYLNNHVDLIPSGTSQTS